MRTWIVFLIALTLASMTALAAEEAKTEEAAPAKCEMVGEISVQTLPAMHVAALMVKAADYAPDGGYPEGMKGAEMAYEKMMTSGFEEMGKWIEAGHQPVGPFLAMYFNDPETSPAIDLSCKIMFPVAADAAGDDKIAIEDLPEMEAAVVQYKGPYGQSDDIWTALGKWVTENGYEYSGAPMEVFLKSPGDNVPPSEYLTEIRWPVKKATPTPEK